MRGWLVAVVVAVPLAARAQTLGGTAIAVGTQGTLAGTSANGSASTLDAVKRAVAPSSTGGSWAQAKDGRSGAGSPASGWATASTVRQHDGGGASGWAKGGQGTASNRWARPGDGPAARSR